MQGRLLYDWERGMIENAAWWHLQPAVLDMDDGARGLKRRPLAPNPHPRLIAYEAEKREFCSVTFLNEATRQERMIDASHPDLSPYLTVRLAVVLRVNPPVAGFPLPRVPVNINVKVP